MKSLLQILKKYDHVIWDWNGTLLNDVGLCIDIVSQFLQEEGLPQLDIQDYRGKFCFPIREYYRRIGLVDSFDEFNRRFIEEYKRRSDELKLFEDARSLLEEIGSHKTGQSILSASEEGLLRQQMERFEIVQNFEFICGLQNFSADCKQDLGRHLLNQGGWQEESVVLVGDTIHDLEVGTELGIDVILLEGGHQCSTILRQRHSQVMSRKGIY